MRTGKDIVIGLDSSTTATKAIAWRQDGTIAGRGRSPIPLLSPADNWYEQDAKGDDVFGGDGWAALILHGRSRRESGARDDVEPVAAGLGEAQVVGELDGIELRRGTELQSWLARSKNIAVDSSVEVPVVAERIAGFGGAIGDKGFEDGTLAVIEKARPGDIVARRIGGEFIFQANGIADVESGFGGIERDFEVNVRWGGGEGLLVLRFEGVPRYRGSSPSEKEEPKQNYELL